MSVPIGQTIMAQHVWLFEAQRQQEVKLRADSWIIRYGYGAQLTSFPAQFFQTKGKGNKAQL